MIGIEEDIVSGKCVRSARICIDSYQKSFIKGWLALDIGELKYHIYAREVSSDPSFVLVSLDSLENDLVDAILVPIRDEFAVEDTSTEATPRLRQIWWR